MSSTAGNVEIMTIREVADYLKVTERTIYRLLSAKRLPGFKVGGSWRFKMVDIDLWIKIQSENVATFGVAAALGERE
jgi:excisionase family DNA binding protein